MPFTTNGRNAKFNQSRKGWDCHCRVLGPEWLAGPGLKFFVKRQFPLFISSLQQQNAPGTESVNSVALLMSAQGRTVREARGNECAAFDDAIALPQRFVRNRCKDAIL